MPTPPLIRPSGDHDELRECACFMAATEPWITLGRNATYLHSVLTRPAFEAHVADVDGAIAGVILIAPDAPVIGGYIAALAVKPEFRNRGIGSALLDFAEQRILRHSPNVFLCVSSFNLDAQKLYRRRGYEQVGCLNNHVISGADELLMRKSTGSWQSFSAQPRT